MTNEKDAKGVGSILEKAEKCLKYPLCDNCLGRQFGQLLSGHTNDERGMIIRKMVAMNLDKQKGAESHTHQFSDIDMSNFLGFKFHSLETSKTQKKTCSLCGGLFQRLDYYAKKAFTAVKKYEFSTFLMGTKLSFDLAQREEDFWEKVGIEHCEPLKAEINMELGKKVEQLTGARFNAKQPNVNIIIDFEKNRVNVDVNPLFIYGEYQKLIRGIPQTKWPSGKYKTSVEQIIAKPFMAATGGKAHKFHGLGREDIDARCLGWRPFVLEITKPKKRSIDISRLARKIDLKKVRTRKMQFSSVDEMRKVKESRADKTYRCVVECENITKKDLEKIKQIGQINQRTPQRVLHRRADLLRRRNVKSMQVKYVNSKKFLLTVKTDAGLYVKELVSGDAGRTKPSISELLGQKCVCKYLDVIKIEWKK
ncbi:MAG TPA: tRNA pseudouridine(54/55) synthase Pus10 [archaeon]|nr:tRNA pseudouridine(54/55) synthase Pus10 [archaeon]